MRGKNKINIGVDLLGSDMRPSDLLEAVLIFSKGLKPSVHLTLFGTPLLFRRRRPPSNATFFPVKEVIEMDDAPLTAIRKKRNSSICLGIKQLKEEELHAFISAGNTGALMGCAKLTLPSLPKVERPALLTLLPTRKNEIAVLDVGANTTYKAKHLVQFAAMGVAYQRSRGVKLPKVGLLNIGSEAKKGTPELQQAYHLLQKKSTSYAFVGNIEGRDVFQGEIDVLVTDGFTGNVFLKTAEGIASVILEEIETSISIDDCSPHNKGLLAEMRSRLHYAEYPGALLCGVDGIVIKCHGNASPQSLTRSIVTAHRLVEHSFLETVRKALKR
jgi:phosphate acyltransferase